MSEVLEELINAYSLKCVRLVKNEFSEFERKKYWDWLSQLPFRRRKIKIHGKSILQPRETLHSSITGNLYSRYSGKNFSSVIFPAVVMNLRQRIGDVLYSIAADCKPAMLNYCLINRYVDGNDYVSWYEENEKEVDLRDPIVSISFGAEREFVLKHKKTDVKYRYQLKDGDILILSRESQTDYFHSIPKKKDTFGRRISLTFRTQRNVSIEYM